MVSDPLPTEVGVGLREFPSPAATERARTVAAARYADERLHRHELQRVFRSDRVCATMHVRVAFGPGELQIVIANEGDTRVGVPGSTVGIEIPPDAVRLTPC
jgi:hypothetical protein